MKLPQRSTHFTGSGCQQAATIPLRGCGRRGPFGLPMAGDCWNPPHCHRRRDAGGSLSLPMKSICCLFALLTLPLPAFSQSRENGASVAVLSGTARSDIPSVSLNLKDGEMLRTFGVTVQSDEDQPLKIFGAQTTGGLYVVDFPAEISTKGQGTVTLLYIARQNATGTTDLLRLMTNRGEKVVQVEHGRQAAVVYDATALQWSEGEGNITKSITFTMVSSVAVPKGVRALGTGNSAVLVALGDNRYRVDVTPASTAKAGQFPVMIQFAPLLPDAPAVISCQILPKE